MENGKFDEKLDKLNRLKNKGILDENGYEEQANKLKKECTKENNNYYDRNLINNINTSRASANINTIVNAIASLFILIVTIICGIWFFSSDMFKDFSTVGKEFINSFGDYTSSENSYSYMPTGTNTTEKNTTSTSTTEASTSKNNSNIPKQTEDKKTYNINVRKVAKELTESIFVNNVYVDSKEVEKYALTVMNYQTETYNSKVRAVKDGEQWVIVNMKFENMSDSTVVINKNDFKIVDGAGRYGYGPYYKHLDTELDTMEIRAGKSATFSVRFAYYKENEMFLRYYNIDFNTTGYGYIDVKLR